MRLIKYIVIHCTAGPLHQTTDTSKEAVEKREFVNHNNDGQLPTLPFLKETFPDNSKFEK